MQVVGLQRPGGRVTDLQRYSHRTWAELQRVAPLEGAKAIRCDATIEVWGSGGPFCLVDGQLGIDTEAIAARQAREDRRAVARLTARRDALIAAAAAHADLDFSAELAEVEAELAERLDRLRGTG